MTPKTKLPKNQVPQLNADENEQNLPMCVRTLVCEEGCEADCKYLAEKDK